MEKFLGVVGSGMIGRDPFSRDCWSGSGYQLFQALIKNNSLEDAIGVEAKNISRYLGLAKNFSFSREIWRKKFYLDTQYYEALTRQVGLEISKYQSTKYLQIGAIYDVPSVASKNSQCFSYHDGNVVEMMQSPIFPHQLRNKAMQARIWEKNVYDKMTKIFTMSEYLRESFINKFNIPENKVINVGVGNNFGAPVSIPYKSRQEKEIVFIGIDFNRKGGNELVRAFSKIKHKHPTAILNIIGPKAVPSILRESAMATGVIFHGFLDRSLQSSSTLFESILNRGSLVILPSLYEPFGIGLLEAMAYGMPGIATNRWAFPEIINSGQTGELIEPGAVDDLAEKMDYYLSNSDIRFQHGVNARESVMSKFSWETVAGKIKAEILS